MLKLPLVNPWIHGLPVNTEMLLLVYGEVLCIFFFDRNSVSAKKAMIWIDGFYINSRKIIINDDFFRFQTSPKFIYHPLW